MPRPCPSQSATWSGTTGPWFTSGSSRSACLSSTTSSRAARSCTRSSSGQRVRGSQTSSSSRSSSALSTSSHGHWRRSRGSRTEKLPMAAAGSGWYTMRAANPRPHGHVPRACPLAVVCPARLLMPRVRSPHRAPGALGAPPLVACAPHRPLLPLL